MKLNSVHLIWFVRLGHEKPRWNEKGHNPH